MLLRPGGRGEGGGEVGKEGGLGEGVDLVGGLGEGVGLVGREGGGVGGLPEVSRQCTQHDSWNVSYVICCAYRWP